MSLEYKNGRFVSPNVDLSRGGKLRISPEMLAHMLRLPDCYEVERVQSSPSGDIEVVIRGGDMPNATEADVRPVMLLFQEEYAVMAGVQERMTAAHFAHAPDRRWVMHNWAAVP